MLYSGLHNYFATFNTALLGTEEVAGIAHNSVMVKLLI